METKFTPGKWTVGKFNSTVISDKTPEKYIGASGHNDTDYYGGFLIAESISSHDAKLIAAAPELLEALQILAGDVEKGPVKFTMEEKLKIARDAIKKAT